MHIIKGSTYRDTLRWATSECVLKPISAVTAMPAARFTCAGHGLVDGWRGSIEGHRSIEEKMSFSLRVIDDNTFEIPCLNAAGFRAQTSPLTLRYNAPVDMDGYSARMQIKDKVGGNVLLELTSAAAAGEARIIIDNAARTIVREIPASVTEAIAWKRGFYDLEMVSGDYVIKIDTGSVTVGDEVTT